MITTELEISTSQKKEDVLSRKESLKNKLYLLFKKNELELDIKISPEEKASFQDFWNYLEIDPYMPDGGKYRLRKIGYLRYNMVTNTLTIDDENVPFVQSTKINNFVGGTERVFAPSSKEFLSSPILKWLINYVISYLPIYKEEVEEVKINVHQMRIKASSGLIGLPTPEGIHQDGHKYVSQHLISRSNISGGVSGLYNSDKTPIVHQMLHDFLDTIVVYDEKIMHDVSPIYSHESDGGYRDMLIIDYNI